MHAYRENEIHHPNHGVCGITAKVGKKLNQTKGVRRSKAGKTDSLPLVAQCRQGRKETADVSVK